MAQNADVADPTAVEDLSLKRFSDAYWDYVKAVYAAWTPPDFQQRVDDARQQSQHAGADPQKQFDAWRSFAKAVNEARNLPELQRRLKDAYADYLKTLQKAWAHVQAQSLSPCQLAAISGASHAVACHAAFIRRGQS